jgi:hypothetical protein
MAGVEGGSVIYQRRVGGSVFLALFRTAAHPLVRPTSMKRFAGNST